jgi:fructose-specific component phosphotransferase system IIB-like protein
MSGTVKWFLITALLLAAAIFAYVRIADALNDYEMQISNPGETQPETPTPPAPDARPWMHDQLIRT